MILSRPGFVDSKPEPSELSDEPPPPVPSSPHDDQPFCPSRHLGNCCRLVPPLRSRHYAHSEPSRGGSGAAYNQAVDLMPAVSLAHNSGGAGGSDDSN